MLLQIKSPIYPCENGTVLKCVRTMQQVYQIINKFIKLPNCVKFQVGDNVFIRTKDSFKPRNIGPYIIGKVLSDVLFAVRNLENEVTQTFVINSDSAPCR